MIQPNAKTLQEIAVSYLFETNENLIKISILLSAAANQGKFFATFDGELSYSEIQALKARGFSYGPYYDPTLKKEILNKTNIYFKE